MASSSTRPASVRGLYTPPTEEWVFLPPSSPVPSHSTSPTPMHLPTPFSTMPDDDDLASLNTGLYGPLQLFAAEYFTTAIGMPFEVGKTLLQVEYRPRKRFAPVEDDLPDGRDWGAEDDELSNPEEADVYFSDRVTAPAAPLEPLETNLEPDASGYFPDLHPSYLLKDDPDISRGNGVWGMIRRIRYTPSEGLPGLWKGQLVTTLHSMLSNILQPQVHTFLLLLAPSHLAHAADIPLTAFPSPGIPLALGLASHLLTHFVLSPLEIIRTRLIVMPSTGPGSSSSVQLFRRMVDEEGGFSTMYFHPNLLIPTLLEHTIRPLLTLSIPLLLERQFGISPELNPITYSLCDLSLGLASLIVILPIETVRRRMQLQSRSKPGINLGVIKPTLRSRSIVKLRERDYVGVVEAIWRIITEETGVRRKRVMTERDEGGVFAGIRQLYRGFGMAATAHLTVFGLGLVSQSLGGGLDGGWKEI
ncbi:mitochondrial carrier domain-containing protein [Naematelia encephala]|uniref:Mitochondrial carrier domain-containing protein n=1 Tax=Naematelia encephala TaxID=71784 RepID=A0A1Y2B330_9TREE|nr:mitochondrial carrier domain-containing protein [Naematelia encephala]